MKKIGLLVSTYKSSADTANELLLPVSAGAALYSGDDPVLSVRDDGGENISWRNPLYCELTVHYYAWKNLDFDVCGLFHQRRYLDFSDPVPLACDHAVKPQTPYRIFDIPDEPTLSRIGLDRQCVETLTERYRIIAPLRENIFQSVEDYYRQHDGGSFDDIGLLKEIIGEKYPDFLPSAEQYFAGHLSYFCNMFVMDRECFDRYSKWLFDLLSAYESRKPHSLIKPREAGKLGERLFGVYMTYIANETEIPWAEVRRAHFASIDGATPDNASFNKKLYAVCPPGSRRRRLIKQLLGK